MALTKSFMCAVQQVEKRNQQMEIKMIVTKYVYRLIFI